MSEDFKQVKALYMDDSYLIKCNAKVTKIGTSEINKKMFHWIQLDETIFHPKGGGQASDEGTINDINVAYVHKNTFDKNRLDQFEILHCFHENQPVNFKVGDTVFLKINPSIRLLHSQLHTAGHLVAEAVSKNFPSLEAFQGNHYLNDSFVRFKILDPSAHFDPNLMKSTIESEIRNWISQNLPVQHSSNNGIRLVKITQNYAPCGGTHVNSLNELPPISISDISINKKDSKITIKYQGS